MLKNKIKSISRCRENNKQIDFFLGQPDLTFLRKDLIYRSFSGCRSTEYPMLRGLPLGSNAERDITRNGPRA